MRWKIYGRVRTGDNYRYTLIGRGLNTLQIGERLLRQVLDFPDGFVVELDADYDELFKDEG
jgi:hypothetical protein